MNCVTCDRKGTLVNRYTTVCSNPQCVWYKKVIVQGPTKTITAKQATAKTPKRLIRIK